MSFWRLDLNQKRLIEKIIERCEYDIKKYLQTLDWRDGTG